jgi:HAD superfamily hydrolase (TIGR01490 family)
MESFQASAAIFDLDHSTLDGNAGVIFTRFLYFRKLLPEAYRKQIPGLVYRYALGRASEAEMVEFGSRCQEGLPAALILQMAAECFAESVQARITKEGREAIRSHLLRGHLVILASGSPYAIVAEAARYLGVHVAIGSKVEIKEGICSGEIAKPLAFEEGKRDLVLDALGRFGIEPRRATLYSDSPADLPLFERVGSPVVVNPPPELERLAKIRGWEVREWSRRVGKGKKKDGIWEL